MAYAKLLRIWKGTLARGRHRRCGRPITWGTDDTNTSRALDPTATPIREETDEAGRQFFVYDPSTAFHHCPPKKKRTPAAQQQESLL